MKKLLLTASSLALLWLGSTGLPAQSGSEPVVGTTPDSSTASGDTFAPNNLFGLLRSYTARIRGSRANISNNGRTIIVIIPSRQINSLQSRLQSPARLQIGKYSRNDVATLQILQGGGNLGAILGQAIGILQQTDPARAARISGLLNSLGQILSAANGNTSALPQADRLLVAANLDTVSSLLQNQNVPSDQWLAQAEPTTPAGTAASTELEVVYASSVDGEVVESPLAGEVVGSVTAHNEAVQSLSADDVVALSSNASFVVAADILEQIAADLRGEPIAAEKLVPIEDIIASLQ